MPVTDQTPNVIIIDSTENLMEVSGGVAVAAGTKGLLFAGIQSNGSASYLLLDSNGRLTVTGTLTIPNTVTVTGSLKLSETATVTGSITVPNTVTVTGTISVTNVPTVTGSITVPNTVTITGSVGVNGQTFVSGSNLSVFVSASNVLTITGSVKLSEALPSGSNNIGGVGITSDPAEGLTGSAAPRTAMFVAGKDLVSGNLHSFHVRTSGTVPTGADNAVVVIVSPNQASIPVSVTG